MALCSMLCYCTQRTEQLDRLFRGSQLMRPKWDEVHFSGGITYGQGTLAKALAWADEHYVPPAPQEKAQSTGHAPEQELRTIAPDESPTLDPKALYGLGGELVQRILPVPEADAVNLLLHLLIQFGNAAGRHLYTRADGTKHLHTNDEREFHSG